jgi:heat shock protein HslJ
MGARFVDQGGLAMKRALVVVFGVVVLLAACNGGQEEPAASPASLAPPSPAATSAELQNVTWVLTPESMTALEPSATDAARVDLAFETDAAHGNSACNTYRGGYTLDGDSLSFGDLATTQMACVDPVASLETAYLTALGEVTGFTLEGTTLTLTGGQTDLAFVAEQPASLTGTTWKATMVGNENALSGVLEDAQPTAEFAKDGTMSGSDGCNTYSAGYETSGSDISISNVATTKMMCDKPIAQQGADFVAALGNATTYELGGTTLTLYGSDGRILVDFVAEG